MLAESKNQLIAEIDKRLEDKIIEKTNADLLKKLIENAEDLKDAIAIAELGTTYKRTGLHFDKRLERKDNTIRYFKKNEELCFYDNSSNLVNKLIIGDNYDALLNLLIEYRGCIDVIYIDPPYGKDNMGQFAETNYNNAITRDNLLSMLYPRLFLAKQLLSKEGVIFCSIDDKNYAYVKCLFDEILLENNFVGSIIWQSATDNNIRQITIEHEYVLCYAKDKNTLDKWIMQSEAALLISDKYKEIKDSGITEPSEIQKILRKWINENKEDLPKVTHYNNVDSKGVYSNSQNSSNTKPGGYTYDIIHPVTGKPCAKPDYGWRWTKETFDNYDKNGDIEWGKDETTQPHVKKRIETVVEQLRSIYSEQGKVYYEDGRASTKLLESIFGQKGMFDNPKPINLIKKLIGYSSNDSAIILDFFAGSGTTGQAVMELNKQDGGNRQFICVQLPENLDDALLKNPNNQTIKNQIDLCDRNKRPHFLSEITVERLRRIMTGYCYNGSNDFSWSKNNKPYGGNLDVYEMGTVSDSENTQGKTAFDVIDETLYGKEKFNTLQGKIEWVCSNFEGTQKYVESDTEWKTRTEAK